MNGTTPAPGQIILSGVFRVNSPGGDLRNYWDGPLIGNNSDIRHGSSETVSSVMPGIKFNI